MNHTAVTSSTAASAVDLVDKDDERLDKHSANDGPLREAVHASAVHAAAQPVEIDVSTAKRAMLDDGGWFEDAALPSQEPPNPNPPLMFEAGETVTVNPLTTPGYPPRFSVSFRTRRW